MIFNSLPRKVTTGLMEPDVIPTSTSIMEAISGDITSLASASSKEVSIPLLEEEGSTLPMYPSKEDLFTILEMALEEIPTLCTFSSSQINRGRNHEGRSEKS